MFEKFVETLNHTGKAVSEKTKQGTDIVKANLKITTEERELNDLFLEIGKLYYKNNSENPCCDQMKELFEKVSEKEAAVEELKSKIRALKGVTVCQNCGAEVDEENAFCGKCGAKIAETKPEDDDIDVVDTAEASETAGEEKTDEACTCEAVPDEKFETESAETTVNVSEDQE